MLLPRLRLLLLLLPTLGLRLLLLPRVAAVSSKGRERREAVRVRDGGDCGGGPGRRREQQLIALAMAAA
jgi:hypothetical protein